jgi:beta-N-acetylhexosaminidase
MKQHEAVFSKMCLEEKIGQMFMVGFKEDHLTSTMKDFINEYNIGFIDIFARNVTSIEQITNLNNQLHSLAKIPPMIFADQEGGVVCQFGELASTFSSMMGLAATHNEGLIEIAGKILSEDMDLVGLDGFIGPTMDVNHEPNNPIIGLRSFSDDPDVVTQFGKAMIRGINQVGLVSMPKHFPGHGGSSLDSHLVLPTIGVSQEFYTSYDLKPFRAVAKTSDFMMTAHISVPSMESSRKPATFSKLFQTKILREKYGFKGVLITDCLEMDVVKNNYTPEQIVLNSIEAGIDVLLLSHSIDFQKTLYKALLSKVQEGYITIERIDMSVKRILAMKEKYAAIEKRKVRDVNTAINKIRNKREIEDFITKHSIVVLRNKLNKIPLPTSKSLGIIEWDKTRSTVQLNEHFHKSYLIDYAEKYFNKAEVLILPLKKTELPVIKTFLESFDNIIVSPYSRTIELEMLQGDMIREILRVRDDVVVVATGNPYDIRYFDDVKTYVATFGFRDTQMHALFDNLTGKFKPCGKLPVEIKGMFPRWYNNNLGE